MPAVESAERDSEEPALDQETGLWGGLTADQIINCCYSRPTPVQREILGWLLSEFRGGRFSVGDVQNRFPENRADLIISGLLFRFRRGGDLPLVIEQVDSRPKTYQVAENTLFVRPAFVSLDENRVAKIAQRLSSVNYPPALYVFANINANDFPLGINIDEVILILESLSIIITKKQAEAAIGAIDLALAEEGFRLRRQGLVKNELDRFGIVASI